jgi:hypothetical protein
LAGFRQLLTRDYDISNAVAELKESIRRQGQERRLRRLEEERAKSGDQGPVRLKRSIPVPAQITTEAQLDELIRQLREVKEQLSFYPEIEVSLTITD